MILSEVNILFCGGEPTVSLHFLEAIALRSADRVQEAVVSDHQWDSIRAGAGLCSEVKTGGVTLSIVVPLFKLHAI